MATDQTIPQEAAANRPRDLLLSLYLFGVRRDCQPFCRIKHLPLAAVEAIAWKHLLRSPRGHLRKDRSPTRKSYDGVEQQAQRIYENMTLLALTFACIIAMRINAGPPFQCFSRFGYQ
jgi:hypothetical protein